MSEKPGYKLMASLTQGAVDEMASLIASTILVCPSAADINGKHHSPPRSLRSSSRVPAGTVLIK